MIIMRTSSLNSNISVVFSVIVDILECKPLLLIITITLSNISYYFPLLLAAVSSNQRCNRSNDIYGDTRGHLMHCMI